MTLWFWNFTLYSFLGFLLEVAYARATGGRCDRKCLLLLPLCPVYGLGACVILWLSPWARGFSPLLFVISAAAATGVEYAAAVFYEKLLGVSFWDYRQLHWNLQGRVCLPFSLAWGCLSLPLVYWIQPVLSPYLASIPRLVTWLAAGTVSVDFLVSSALLRRTKDRACLRWYA